MNIFQTLAIYVGGPLVIYGGIALLSLLPSRNKRRLKYRPGQDWDYPPQWWAGDHQIAPADQALVVAGTEGGARGTW